MKKLSLFLSLCFSIFSLTAQDLASPNGNLKMNFSLQEDGSPQYELQYKGKIVIKPSKLGLELKNEEHSFLNNFSIVETATNSFSETWEPVWGEESEIENNYNELLVELKQEDAGRNLKIRFRLFDTGLGFRYEFPIQENLGHFVIKEERDRKSVV